MIRRVFFKRAYELATVRHRKVHRYNANVPWGSLNEKAALMGMHKTSYDKTAKMVIAELVSRSNEVIYFPPKAEQVFLQTCRVRKPFPGGLFAIDGTLCRCTEKGR